MKRYFVFILAGIAVVMVLYSAHAQIVTAPSVPQHFTATGDGISKATLSWDAATESAPGGVAGYNIFRNSKWIATSTATSYVDSGLSPGLYIYTVVAYDIYGYTSPTQATPQSVLIVTDWQPPTVPANLAATGTLFVNSSTASTPVTLSWSSSTDNIAVAGYIVYRNGAAINATSSIYTSPTMTENLSPGTYTYKVNAYDTSWNGSTYSPSLTVTVGVDSLPPSVPTGVSVSQTAPNKATLSWTPSIDVGVGTAGYLIYRSSTQIATVSSSPYIDSRLTTGTEYIYQIAAYDGVGNVSDESGIWTRVTLRDNYVAPVASSTETASTGSGTSATAASGVAASSVGTATSAGTVFTQFLYAGLRSQQVRALQLLLVGKGYLSSTSATGYFGNLTLRALQQFQCAQKIVCTGGAGWGVVGPKTRSVLNGL
jgi:cellulose 1,4-beta-cellobiosidase